MNKKVIIAIMVTSFIIGMCMFIVGFVAGTSQIDAGGVLKEICTVIFPPAVGGLLIVYIFSMILDVLTGIMKANFSGEFTSGAMRKGLEKKIAMIALIGVALLTNAALYMIGFTVSHYLMLIAICPLIYMELASVMENIGQMGVKIPSGLKKALKVLHDKGEEEVKK